VGTGTTSAAAPKAVELTRDHSPLVWEERQRIQAAGGTVTDGRVLGQLEVSRALGDGRFKTVGVIATPEVRPWHRACVPEGV
jgi:integrin-linked kinase-associated serine/threonine phosphatase 2C